MIGSGFINFVSTVATCHILHKAEEAGLLDQMSYSERMDDLSFAWGKSDAPFAPAADDGYWAHTLKTVFEELEALRLSAPVPKPEPRKHGRKPKPKDRGEGKPKRLVGCPRKNTRLCYPYGLLSFFRRVELAFVQQSKKHT